jgi:hypothetical protein
MSGCRKPIREAFPECHTQKKYEYVKGPCD